MMLIHIVSFQFDLPLWALVLAFICGTIASYYMYMTWHFGIFNELGIPFEKPIPVLGNMYSVMTQGYMKHDIDIVQKYGPVSGAFLGRCPQILITDPEMIKQVMVKEFPTFQNRMRILLGDELLSNMMSVCDGEQWKNLRTTLSPTFSSRKIKQMVKQINACADQLVMHLDEKAASGESFDYRDFSGSYAMDVKASVLFGIDIDSHGDKNCDFVKMAKKAFDMSFGSLNMIIPLFFPFLTPLFQWLQIAGFNKESRAFFTSVVKQAIKQRKESKTDHMDFLQLMINAHDDHDDHASEPELTDLLEEQNPSSLLHARLINGSKKKLSELEILSQALLFFLAGYETTSNTTGFMAYSLATNPECQERAREEVMQVLQDDKDDVPYEALHKLKYIQQIIEETLRLYPQGTRSDRVAGKDIILKGIHIPKGVDVTIPILAIHYDPNIYPDPEKFDPERFSPEAKKSRDTFTHFGFGFGPRNCIGMRLAIMEMKIGMAKVLKKYRFVVCKDTEIPLKLKSALGPVVAENGFIIKLERL